MVSGPVLSVTGLVLSAVGLTLFFRGRSLAALTLLQVGLLCFALGMSSVLLVLITWWFARLRVVELKILRGRDATATKLGSELKQQVYHVLHYLGHGSDSGLSLVSDDGQRHEALGGEAFAKLIEGQRALRLVVLSACHSAQGDRLDIFSGVGSTLVRASVPGVVAMQYPTVQVDTAGLFSDSLYEGLARGQPVDAAVNDGRRGLAVRFAADRDWSTPVLFLGTPSFDVVAPRLRGGWLGPWFKPSAAWIRPAFDLLRSRPGLIFCIASGAAVILSAAIMVPVL
jgi:hypothetical protein